MFRSIRTRIAVVFSLIVFTAVLAACLLILWLTNEDNPVPVLVNIVLPVIVSGIIAVLIAAYIIAGHISGPVQKVIELSQKLANRENPDQQVRVNSKDEIGRLVDAFNRMISSSKYLSGISINKDYIYGILDRTNEGVIIVDQNKRVMLINKSASRTFNIDKERAVGRPFIEVSMDHEIQGMLNRCLALREQKSAVIQISPGKKSLGVNTSSMPDNSGCLILLQDLSEIQRSRTTRRDFITNISHELRTPVTSIKVLAETLIQGAIDDKRISAEYLKKIETEADRLAHLISEMSEMLKMEGGYAPLKKSVFSASDLLEDATGRLRPQAGRSGLTLSVNIPGELPQINADKEKLEHVLINLIQNSIKFTPPGGMITLSAEAIPGAIQFSVEDTGIGIPADDLSRVFERFYKVDKARTVGGTGLGLAIAKQIVEEHGGRIRADSIEGKGSTFYFTIPVS